MKIDRDSLSEIGTTVVRNKSRSLLTAFGVFWGIFMLVVMLGGGQGLQDKLSQNFKGFATNSAFVFSGRTTMPYKGFQKGRSWTLENADVTRLRAALPQLDVVTPLLMFYGKTAAVKDLKTSCSIYGIYPDMARVEQTDIRYGRTINDMDIHEERKVCVIGKRIYKELFPGGGDPCGQFIKVENSYYRIVGVNYGGSNISMGGDPETTIQVPFPVLQKAQNYGNRVDALALTAHSGYRISTLEPQIRQIIYRAHYVDPDDKFASFIFSAELMFTMMDNLFRGVRFLIWLVGLGTLLAGVVGVSNIMMVTVKERTVEFGIRRAIGARPTDILLQVILESLLLTVLAGMAGITFAVFVLQCLELANTVDGIPTAQFQVSFGFAVGAACLVALLGIVAGLAPALRALHIKPVDAMRDE